MLGRLKHASCSWVCNTYMRPLASHRHTLRACRSPVVLAPLLSSGFAPGRVVSTAEVWELPEHPILLPAHAAMVDSGVAGLRRGLQLRWWRRAQISSLLMEINLHAIPVDGPLDGEQKCTMVVKFLQELRITSLPPRNSVQLFVLWQQVTKQLCTQVKCGFPLCTVT